jgi:hypothetical protein
VSDHQHYEYAGDGHRHDHEYAEYQHRHYDDESAVRGLREDLGYAENRIRGLENDVRDAFALIRRLDRLRPTCVICLDATADRQTSRGPACTDCTGDLPDDGPDHEPPGPGVLASYAPMGRHDDPPAPADPAGLPECGRIEPHEPHEYRMFPGDVRAHCGGMP